MVTSISQIGIGHCLAREKINELDISTGVVCCELSLYDVNYVVFTGSGYEELVMCTTYVRFTGRNGLKVLNLQFAGVTLRAYLHQL